MNKAVLIAVISFSVALFDYITKKIIVSKLLLYESIHVLPFLNIVYVENRGAAFSILSNLGNKYFIALSVIAIIVIILYLAKLPRGLELYGMSLILGGAAGNLMDRIREGKVIDFIDMKDRKHIRDVEKTLREELRKDKAKTDTASISKFGLMELSRQRLNPSIESKSYQQCDQCQGRGMVMSVEASAVSFLRRIRMGISKGNIREVTGILPANVAGYIQNKKRSELIEIEKRYGTNIVINKDYQKGQLSSLIAAIEDTPQETDAILVCLVDNPFITKEVINKIIAKFRETNNPIIVPVFNGKRGHPTLFSRTLFSELVNAPYIEEFPMVLECKLLHTLEIGLHTQFVGEIVDLKVDEDLVGDKGTPDIEKVKPFQELLGGEEWTTMQY